MWKKRRFPWASGGGWPVAGAAASLGVRSVITVVARVVAIGFAGGALAGVAAQTLSGPALSSSALSVSDPPTDSGREPVPSNPVLPGVADAGVMKYNGKYYLGGVGTDGDFYISPDLVHWPGRVHAVTMDNDWTRGTGAGNDQIHANDLLYLNGEFHLYWSVNYWGKDKHAVHIVHARSDSASGPYAEPDRTTWLDNRIDPKVFRDDDGRLYMYMVRFTDGNAIWGRRMKNPSAFAGEPVCQFASLPDTWETMDNRVAEGPWVMKYRNRYYMMYNANHTAPEWGNYQLGVAEADTPLGFQHGGKYSYPVVLSNQVRLEEESVDRLRYSEAGYDPLFAYATSQPADGWQAAAFDDAAWQRGPGGFGCEALEGSTTRPRGTVWTTPALWVRKAFRMPAADAPQTGKKLLRVAHDGDTRIYLNGRLVYDRQGPGYRIVALEGAALAALHPGENLLAAETRGGRKHFFNVSLFDAASDADTDILMTPGQPNILRGPNGFEWWLIYMANKNDEPRGQFIDRVHFRGKTLSVDAPTAGHTPGYHPRPARPTFGDTFDDAATLAHYRCGSASASTSGGQPLAPWRIAGGELRKAAGNAGHLLVEKARPATCYLWEAGVKTAGEAGVIAWWKDSSHQVRVGLDCARKNWYIQTCLEGNTHTLSYALPEDFRPGVYHAWRIERNGPALKVFLDELPAPGRSYFPALLPGGEPGRPGLFAEAGEAAFDGLTYTIGFDDFDDTMPGWEAARGSFRPAAAHGLQAVADTVEAFKGVRLDRYEFDFQLDGLTGRGEAGCYPLYVDKDNYVQAVFHAATRSLEVREVKRGRLQARRRYPLDRLQTLYPDVKYTDFLEKGYVPEAPVWIDALYLSRHEAGRPSAFAANMFDRFRVEYQQGGVWRPLDTAGAGRSSHPAYNRLSFPPVRAEKLRLINKEAADLARHTYQIRLHLLWKERYYFRAVREKDTLRLFVDAKEIATFPVDYPASRIGLWAEGCRPAFNGILYYHRN